MFTFEEANANGLFVSTTERKLEAKGAGKRFWITHRSRCPLWRIEHAR